MLNIPFRVNVASAVHKMFCMNSGLASCCWSIHLQSSIRRGKSSGSNPWTRLKCKTTKQNCQSSTMDYEEVANLINLTFDQEVTPTQSMQLLTQEIIFSIFVVVGIVADVAISYTIFRFKRLHTVPNIFLANWAVADICSLIFTPSSFRLISIIDNEALSGEFICVLFQTDFIFHHTAITFMIIILLDWCLAAFFSSSSKKFRSFCKYLIAAVWIFDLLFLSGLIRFCIRHVYYHLSLLLFVFDYCAIFLLVVALQCTRAVRKCTQKPLTYPTLMLTLVTVYATCWLVGFLNLFIESPEGVHPVVEIVTECFIFSSAIVNFTLLYRSSKDFQACFQQILRRQEDRYVDNLSEFENNDKSISDKSTVQISLENTNLP